MDKRSMRFIHTAYLATGERGKWVKRRVTVANGSVYQKEFYEAHREGFKPDKMVYIHNADYRGEAYIEVTEGGEQVMMVIYRTYVNEETGITELYLTKKVGVR